MLSVQYCAPAGSIKNFMHELKESLDIVFANAGAHEHTIMGDFNIGFGHKEAVHSKNLKDLLGDFGMQYLETSATCVTSKGKSTLDLMFTDMKFIVDHGVMNVVISDHLPIYIIKKKGQI